MVKVCDGCENNIDDCYPNKLGECIIKPERNVKMADKIDNTLEDRGKSYGDFTKMSETTQQIKQTIRRGAVYDALLDYQLEALDLIATKIARIVDGDPYHEDSWHDIIGYATLARDRVREELEPKISPSPLASDAQMPIIKKSCICLSHATGEIFNCPVHGPQE